MAVTHSPHPSTTCRFDSVRFVLDTKNNPRPHVDDNPTLKVTMLGSPEADDKNPTRERHTALVYINESNVMRLEITVAPILKKIMGVRRVEGTGWSNVVEMWGVRYVVMGDRTVKAVDAATSRKQRVVVLCNECDCVVLQVMNKNRYRDVVVKILLSEGRTCIEEVKILMVSDYWTHENFHTECLVMNKKKW